MIVVGLSYKLLYEACHQFSYALFVIRLHARRSIWLNKFAQQFVPMLGLLALRGVVGIGQFVVTKLGGDKTDPMQELADELGAHTAKEFNVGSNAKKLGTTAVLLKFAYCHPWSDHWYHVPNTSAAQILHARMPSASGTMHAQECHVTLFNFQKYDAMCLLG